MVRVKHRYLLVDILYPDSKDGFNAAKAQSGNDLPYTVQFRQPSSDRIDIKFLMKLIRDGVSELFGDYGTGMVAGSLQIKYFSPATSTAIIRVSRDHFRLIWAALAFTTYFPKPVEQPCVMQVVRVSGTIKKAEEEAIRRARLSIKRAQRSSERAKLTGSDAGVLAALNEDDGVDDFPDFANGIEDPDAPGADDEDSD